MLADPHACKHRNNINSQKSDVGTSARPMQDSDRISRQAADTGRRPTWSDTGPHNIGARNARRQKTFRGAGEVIKHRRRHSEVFLMSFTLTGNHQVCSRASFTYPHPARPRTWSPVWRSVVHPTLYEYVRYSPTVRFISSVDLLNATASVGIAGKYILEVNGLA